MRDKMHKMMRWGTIACVTFALGGGAYAEVGSANPSTSKDKSAAAAKSDGAPKAGATCTLDDAAKTRMVLAFLHTANGSELKHSKLAMQTSQSSDVKALADHMMKDHSDADGKLLELAKKKGMDLTMDDGAKGPADPIHAAVHGMDAKLSKELATKSGSAFDAAFLGGEVSGHLLVLSVIEEGQKSAKDGDVKALLGDMHKAVTTHRDHAAQLADKLRLTGGKPVGGGPKSEKPDPKAGTGLQDHQDK